MTTGRIAWFHCFAGIAGDMALGSLIDAGADLSEVTAIVGALPIGGWGVQAEVVLRAGISATRVVVNRDPDPRPRTYRDIKEILAKAALPARVRERSEAIFAALASAEARVHRLDPEELHFHEVGALDAIVDVVGTCAALEVLGIEEVQSSPVAIGMGLVGCDHGILPNPGPAVVELLKGVPTRGRDVESEMTTPTGAAIISALCSGFGPQPAMTVEASGFGAGLRDTDGFPNATQVLIGTAAQKGPNRALPPGQPVVLLETNLDDVTGETLSDAVTALIAAGAHDAWVSGIVMKKGRPAHTLSALCDIALVEALIGVIARTTGTMGVRGQVLERWPASRDQAEVEVAGHIIGVKVAAHRVKVEHDDARAASEALGISIHEVVSLAEAEWARVHESPGQA